MKSYSSASDEISEPALFTYSGRQYFLQNPAKSNTPEEKEAEDIESQENSEQLVDILSE